MRRPRCAPMRCLARPARMAHRPAPTGTARAMIPGTALSQTTTSPCGAFPMTGVASRKRTETRVTRQWAAYLAQTLCATRRSGCGEAGRCTALSLSPSPYTIDWLRAAFRATPARRAAAATKSVPRRRSAATPPACPRCARSSRVLDREADTRRPARAARPRRVMPGPRLATTLAVRGGLLLLFAQFRLRQQLPGHVRAVQLASHRRDVQGAGTVDVRCRDRGASGWRSGVGRGAAYPVLPSPCAGPLHLRVGAGGRPARCVERLVDDRRVRLGVGLEWRVAALPLLHARAGGAAAGGCGRLTHVLPDQRVHWAAAGDQRRLQPAGQPAPPPRGGRRRAGTAPPRTAV